MEYNLEHLNMCKHLESVMYVYWLHITCNMIPRNAGVMVNVTRM